MFQKVAFLRMLIQLAEGVFHNGRIMARGC